MKTTLSLLLLLGYLGSLSVLNAQEAESKTKTANDLEELLHQRKITLQNYQPAVKKAAIALQDLKKYDSIRVLFEKYQKGLRTVQRMYAMTQAINQHKFSDYQELNGLLKNTQYNIGTDWINQQNLPRYLPNIQIVFKKYSAVITPVAKEAAIKLSFSQYLLKMYHKRTKELESEYRIKWAGLVSLYDAIRSLYVIKKSVTPMLQNGVVENEFERVRKGRIYRPGMKVYKRYIQLIKNVGFYRDKLQYIRKAELFLYKMRDLYHAKNTKTFGKILRKVKDVENIESMMMKYQVE